MLILHFLKPCHKNGINILYLIKDSGDVNFDNNLNSEEPIMMATWKNKHVCSWIRAGYSNIIIVNFIMMDYFPQQKNNNITI